jgi:glycosyltransferase involved in cell wall biosynthesis
MADACSDGPAISVLLPVYNAERFVAEAVESILAQTFGDFELLALDDGSSDGSLLILREFAARDARMVVRSRENRGLVASLNELISYARGPYLARMDADDVCMPDRFLKQSGFLNSFPDHVLVGGWIEFRSEAGQPIGVIKTPVAHEEIDRSHVKGYSSVWHPTAMIRKASVERLGGYRPQFTSAEDLDLWLRLAEIGKIANLPEVVLGYRLLDGSISGSKRGEQRESARRACESAYRRRGIESQFEAESHWRAGEDSASRHEFALRYGWIAWSHGHRETWWTYVWEAIRLKPFALSSWQLLVFGALKRPSPPSGPDCENQSSRA